MNNFKEAYKFYLENALKVKDYVLKDIDDNRFIITFTGPNPLDENSITEITIYCEKPGFVQYKFVICTVKPSLKLYQAIDNFNIKEGFLNAHIYDDKLIISHSCYIIQNSDNALKLLDFIIGKIYSTSLENIKELVLSSVN